MSCDLTPGDRDVRCKDMLLVMSLMSARYRIVASHPGARVRLYIKECGLEVSGTIEQWASVLIAKLRVMRRRTRRGNEEDEGT